MKAHVTSFALLLLAAMCSAEWLDPRSWDPATQQEAIQVLRKAGLIRGNVATMGNPDNPSSNFAGKYLVMFEAGMGCTLWSAHTGPFSPCRGSICPAAVLAFGKAMPANKVSKGYYQCRFMKSDVVPMQPYQELLIKHQGFDEQLFKLDDPASIAAENVLCAYNVFSPTLVNNTMTIPNEDGTEVEEVSAALGGLALVTDKPMLAGLIPTQGSLNVYCKVNDSIARSPELLANRTMVQLPFDSCFPGRAEVITPDGPKPISQLRVGDLVQSGVDPATGSAVFDHVYLTPHRDSSSFNSYLNLHVAAGGCAVLANTCSSTKVLTVSTRHYVPTACCQPSGGGCSKCLKHAGQVVVGDQVWLVQGEGQAAVLGTVTQVTTSFEQGLYSPWTMTGSILVDGVAASTHTAWPGEAALLQLLPPATAARAAHLLAVGHQVVQSPLRVLYKLLGAGPLQLIDSVVFQVVEAATGGRSSSGLSAAGKAFLAGPGISAHSIAAA